MLMVLIGSQVKIPIENSGSCCCAAAFRNSAHTGAAPHRRRTCCRMRNLSDTRTAAQVTPRETPRLRLASGVNGRPAISCSRRRSRSFSSRPAVQPAQAHMHMAYPSPGGGRRGRRRRCSTPLRQVSLKVVPDARNETQHPKGSMLLSPLEVDESSELQDVCSVRHLRVSSTRLTRRGSTAMLQPWRLNSIRGFALLTCVGEILAPESLTRQLPVAFTSRRLHCTSLQ